MATPLLLLSLLACGTVTDEDLDGVEAELDCDDADPFVYPGAPDDPGDGVDADCDGSDPAWPFIGSWALVSLEASYAGIPLFAPGTEVGGLIMDDAFGLTVDVGITLDEIITGSPLPIALAMSGWSSPMDGDGWVSLWAEGELYDEQMHIDWVCQVEPESADGGAGMACAGELKALEASLDATAWFEAE